MAIQKPGVIEDWDLAYQQVEFYKDHLDIFIEDAFPPIKLTETQHIIARQFGRCDDMKTVCSRGYGKTFVIALCAFAWCCLNPGTIVFVCSATAQQATLVFGKLRMLVQRNANMRAQLKANNAKSLIQISKDKGSCYFKNGSIMESNTLDSARGHRAKVVIIDEALQLDLELLNAVVDPLKNYTREIAKENDYDDYPSKTISITSACQKTNDFYRDFERVVRDMAKGVPTSFACALNYEAAIADGISKRQFFERERAKMPISVFSMEYNSIFQGAVSNAAFPYELTQGCRTLQKVQLEQPKNSKSRYVISLDIATSDADGADNAIICVIKFTEKSDGSFAKKLVNIRSFHGKGLDVLANEIRQYHLKFPNTQRIIYDARGLGDSFGKFLDEPWIDPTSGKQYPPLVHDDGAMIVDNAMPILHAVRAVQTLNQRIATNLRVMLEKKTLQLPINSRILQAKRADAQDATPMDMKEIAIFIETDALQFELGNIVAKVSQAGNYIYDTPRANMHKDRYSSLAYGCDYIAQLQAENIKSKTRGPVCIGFATRF